MHISTHVLDLTRGQPAAGIAVRLERMEGDDGKPVGEGVTDQDGRIADLRGGTAMGAGSYRLTFETGAYFRAAGTESFHPRVTVEFEIRDTGRSYHVPLLLSPFGYTTYRGS